jgi:hypothetical protein
MRAGAADLTARGIPPPPSSSAASGILSGHAETFVDGYNAALIAHGHEDLSHRLEQAPSGRTGFWVEGAAMSSALLDTFSVRPHRIDSLVAGAGRQHSYLIHVGVGWAVARLHVLRPDVRRRLDPLLRWLVWDGLGFARGFFAPRRHLLRQVPPLPGGGYRSRVADQGLGRCLWFYGAADPDVVSRLVDAIPLARQADLWSGVGLAATYAGGAPAEVLTSLVEAAGPFRADLAQGAVFGATARLAADEVLPGTRSTSLTLSGLSPSDAAELADEARRGCHQGTAEDYERWRQRIRERITVEAGRS